MGNNETKNWRVSTAKGCTDKIKECFIKLLRQNNIEIENNSTDTESFIDIILADIPDNSEISNYDLISPDNRLSIYSTENSLCEQLQQVFEKEDIFREINLLLENAVNFLKNEINTKSGFLYKYKKINSDGPGLGKIYRVVFIILKNEALNCDDLLNYILLFVLDKINAVKDFENAFDDNEYALLNCFSEKGILLEKYAEYFLRENNLPVAELLIDLSATRYEGSNSEARIYFTKSNIAVIETFTNIGSSTRIICKNNIHTLRKLLEISKRDKIYLYAEDINKTNEFTVSQLVKPKKCDNECSKKEYNDIYIKFSGFMHWSVIAGEKERLKYYHGRYEVGTFNENTKYVNDINKLKNVDTRMIIELVKILKKQKHGTSVIIFDCGNNEKNEADRLCGLNRGFRISSGICYNAGWDEDQLLSITDIDGALFMSLDGKCLAIGVIVDGEVTVKGDPGRGARYNSIYNYVHQQEKGNYIGIVISEDGMIDVFQN